MIRFRFFPHSHATVPRREEERRERRERREEEKGRREEERRREGAYSHESQVQALNTKSGR